MPALKLSMAAASLCSKPYKWPRSSSSSFPPSSPSPPNSSSAAVPFPSSPPSAAALCSVPVSCDRAWRRIPPCAHGAHFNDYYRYQFFSCSNSNNNKRKDIYFNISGSCSSSSLLSLGLPSSSPGGSNSGRSLFSSSHSCLLRNCGSPSFAAGFSAGSDSSSSSPSGSSGGVIAEDMGSGNKAGVEWYPGGGDGVNGLDRPSSSSASPSPDRHRKQECSSKFLTLPTILTLGRVASVPLLISTFYVDTWLGRGATTSIFIAAAVTDWLDGYLARKMRLGSAFGAFLDPVADKLMVAATLVLLCTRPLEVPMFGPVPWLLTVPSIAIIGREITMSAVREWAASQDTKLLEAVAVNNLGKWKTATQMIALTILLATRDGGVGGPGVLVASGVGLLYISAGLSVYSLAVYMSKIWKVLLK